MLTFNNKILTVSNKGLEVAAGPTPPAPGPELLYTQAVQNYTGGGTTVMASHTWDTNKNFICYKMSVCVKSYFNDMYDVYYRGLQVGGNSYISFGRYSNFSSASNKTSTFFFTTGTSSVGTDGQSFSADFVPQGSSYKANPDIKVSTNDGVITYRIVFDKTQNKAYCYITDKQVMVVDYGSTDVLGMSISNTIGNYDNPSMDSNVDFGIQVYACDSLADAEGV
jgi:hypothetical protein